MRVIGWIGIAMVAVSAVGAGMGPEARQSYAAFEQKVEAGDPEAMYRMSALLEQGFDTIPADTLRSVELLRRSARADYLPAMNYLGFLYQTGNILPTNPDSAFYWIRRAADAGDPKASHNLAYLLLDQPVPDYRTAIGYLQRAADAGMAQAMTLLGSLYAEGRGLPTDTLRAEALFQSAIDSGFSDAELRLLNLRGRDWMLLSSDQLLPLAIDFWKRGAHTIASELLLHIAPDASQTAHAYALLGIAYSRGLGVPYDHRKSLEYFAEASRLGNPSAQFILSETLEIFPDALNDILAGEDVNTDVGEDWNTHTDHSIFDAQSLREKAAEAGIHTPAEATEHLLFAP